MHAPLGTEAQTRSARRPPRRLLLGCAALLVLAAAIRVATTPPANAGRAQRDFDPVQIGAREQAMWEAYYFRRWPTLFWLLLQVTRDQFGLSYAQSVYAAYLGTVAQADFARNGVDGGRPEAYMRDFYAYVQGPTGGHYDPTRAAQKELRWWVVHREAAHHTRDSQALEDAFADLYVEVYGLSDAQARPAARARAEAVALSDDWLDADKPPDSPLLGQIRDALIRSYRALHDAMNGPPAR